MKMRHRSVLSVRREEREDLRCKKYFSLNFFCPSDAVKHVGDRGCGISNPRLVRVLRPRVCRPVAATRSVRLGRISIASLFSGPLWRTCWQTVCAEWISKVFSALDDGGPSVVVSRPKRQTVTVTHPMWRMRMYVHERTKYLTGFHKLFRFRSSIDRRFGCGKNHVKRCV